MSRFAEWIHETERCLWCHEYYHEPVEWRWVLGLKESSSLCPRCSAQLKKITKVSCEICGRPPQQNMHIEINPDQQKNHLHNEEVPICTDCIRWKTVAPWDQYPFQHRALYEYNGFLQEVLARFKYRGDAEIAKLFSEKIKALVKSLGRFDLVTVIPLSAGREWERGFNQAELLAMELPVQKTLRRVGEPKRKQSKSSREERIAALSGTFEINGETKVSGKKVVIIDDIYTTGATVRSAASCLYKAGAKHVSAVTVARSTGERK
ncbi:ComF family protein [Bacillus shivajii]|uniref:ComF family protein n=1 Tax=Bacillus shivajii TaxID=1983719 RepID=UPI001CFBD403|nr:ComF family protein [Bacillus shivajii]UCZ52699.1 ComF family protein [Bacillus shivajii]